jgi:Fe2+ transport system protein FeoA
MMNLAQVNEGKKVRVKRIEDEDAREYLLRIGIEEGGAIVCSANIARGPVIVRHRRKVMALGRDLSEKIEVTEL